MKSHHWLLGALVAGISTGLALSGSSTVPWVEGMRTWILDPVGQIFLRLLLMSVVPIVFSALVLGVLELARGHEIGKIAAKTLAVTVVTSAASVLIGVTLVNMIRPGVGVVPPQDLAQSFGSNVDKIKANAAGAKPILQALLDLIPKNPIDAAARALDGEMISLMVFALIFGWALSRVKSRDGVVGVLEGIYGAGLHIVGLAMRLAPLAVFALVTSSVMRSGLQLVVSLSAYVGVVLAALLIQQFGVYSLLLKLFTRRKPLEFFSQCREVYLSAFATASSNATLPKSLECAEKELKLSPEVSRFVLTVGSTANQNGTALFEGITVLFLAQVYSVDLSLSQQVHVVLMSVLAGIGTAGVPGGSLPLIMILLQQVGIPPEGIALVLGVDRFLDMCRTTINVSGDLVIAAVVDPKRKTWSLT